MPTEIMIPRETANDDVVRVVRWLAKAGDEVRAGVAVVEIETSKSVIEVTAPSAGRLAILHEVGAEVPVGGVVGTLTAASEHTAAQAPAPTGAASPQTHAQASAPATGPTISRKAREKLALHGLDESAVAHLAIVRESDVDAIVAARQPQKPAPAPADAAVPVPQSPPTRPYPSRGLLGDAQRSAGDRGTSVFALALNYLWRNWLLGNVVRVAPVGIRNVLHRWRGVKMGRDCFIDPNAILETAYPENITLGDDVRVTAGAIVMTHIKAPHLLRDKGYVPAVLKPVVLRSHSFIGVNSVVMPGVTVGEGAVVASGSVVLADVPSYTMVAGNPAKVVKRFV
jgi:acetyltransferase-like isoleucine patch superfamily enzyme